MSEREQLANSIFEILINQQCLTEEVKQRIILAIDDFEIQKRSTKLAVLDSTSNTSVIKQFMLAKAVAGRSDKTIKQYVWAIQKYIRVIGKKLVDTTPEDIRLFTAYRMTKDDVHGLGLENERRYLSSFFEWAIKEGLMLRNPVKQTELIKIPRLPKRAFTELECEKIRNSCETLREKAVVEVLFSTACRASELSTIRLDSIQGNRVSIVGKGNKYGVVFLESKAILAIEKYIESRKDDNPFLFPGRSSSGISKGTVEKIVRTVGKRADVENVYPHRFRRTTATYALKRGMPIEMVSKMLRHEKISTTMIYLDLSEDELSYQHEKYVV